MIAEETKISSPHYDSSNNRTNIDVENLINARNQRKKRICRQVFNTIEYLLTLLATFLFYACCVVAHIHTTNIIVGCLFLWCILYFARCLRLVKAALNGAIRLHHVKSAYLQITKNICDLASCMLLACYSYSKRNAFKPLIIFPIIISTGLHILCIILAKEPCIRFKEMLAIVYSTIKAFQFSLLISSNLLDNLLPFLMPFWMLCMISFMMFVYSSSIMAFCIYFSLKEGKVRKESTLLI